MNFETILSSDLVAASTVLIEGENPTPSEAPQPTEEPSVSGGDSSTAGITKDDLMESTNMIIETITEISNEPNFFEKSIDDYTSIEWLLIIIIVALLWSLFLNYIGGFFK